MNEFIWYTITKMLKLLMLLIGSFTLVHGHGLMLEPIAMSAKLVWNFDSSGVKDYDAHGLFCGGVQNSYTDYNNNPTQFPKCGVCGDSPNGPFDHEPNGKFYDDRIVGTYFNDDIIQVSTAITASHLGSMYFDIKCLDNQSWSDTEFQILYQPDGTMNMTIPSYDSAVYNASYVIPKGFTCNKAIFRWNWLAANNPPSGGHPNEFYRNCAFITVSNSEC